MLSCSEHLRLHAEEHKRDEEWLEKARKNMQKANEAACKWHRSEEGHKWHKKQAKETLAMILPKKFVCENCGKEFYSKPNGFNRFCSNACKTAWRVKSGKDNETRICVICGKEFVTNKYYPKKTCSRQCGYKLLSQVKKKH